MYSLNYVYNKESVLGHAGPGMFPSLAYMMLINYWSWIWNLIIFREIMWTIKYNKPFKCNKHGHYHAQCIHLRHILIQVWHENRQLVTSLMSSYLGMKHKRLTYGQYLGICLGEIKVRLGTVWSNMSLKLNYLHSGSLLCYIYKTPCPTFQRTTHIFWCAYICTEQRRMTQNKNMGGGLNCFRAWFAYVRHC